MELQENLIRLRHRRHLSQEQLAEQLGVARQTVSRWEVGTVIPTADNLLALGTLYGVSVEELMDGNVEDILKGCEVDKFKPSKVEPEEKSLEETEQTEVPQSEDVPPVVPEPLPASGIRESYNKWIFLVILACLYAGVLLWGQLTHSTGDAKIFLVFVTFLLILVRVLYRLKNL